MMRLALLGIGLIVCLAWLLYIVASFSASTTHRRMNEAFYALPLWGKLLCVAVILGISLFVAALHSGPQRVY